MDPTQGIDSSSAGHLGRNTSRTRQGCFACRLRKKRCDSQNRGKCTDCTKFAFECIGHGLGRPPPEVVDEMKRVMDGWMEERAYRHQSRGVLPLSNICLVGHQVGVYGGLLTPLQVPDQSSTGPSSATTPTSPYNHMPDNEVTIANTPGNDNSSISGMTHPPKRPGSIGFAFEPDAPQVPVDPNHLSALLDNVMHPERYIDGSFVLYEYGIMPPTRSAQPEGLPDSPMEITVSKPDGLGLGLDVGSANQSTAGPSSSPWNTSSPSLLFPPQ